MSESSQKMTIMFLQLNSWFQGELPHPTTILSLLELFNKALRSNPSRHTVIICRSASLFPIYIWLSVVPLNVASEKTHLSPLHSFISLSLPLTVMEWGEQGPSSASTPSWRDSKQRVWLTSSRLPSLLVSRDLALSLML